MLEVVEHFLSLSGEAPILGEPTYFYRFTGCNLNCSYCDTLYKNEINFRFTEKELISDIQKHYFSYPGIKILFTGGEPLFGERKDSLLRVIEQLPDIDFYIETNGAADIPETDLENCHFVCDVKSPFSGEGSSFIKSNIFKLRPDKDCIKLVVAKKDLRWLKDRIIDIKKENKKIKIYVSPVYGNIEMEKLAAFIIDNKLPAALSIQLHKILWPDIERGV